MNGAFATVLAAAWTPAPPPVRVVSSWPPVGADPQHTWTEGVSAGPLGRAPDVLFERLFRRALAREFGRDSPRPGFAGIVQLVQQLVSRSKNAHCKNVRIPG